MGRWRPGVRARSAARVANGPSGATFLPSGGKASRTWAKLSRLASISWRRRHPDAASNRDMSALHLKLDELIRVKEDARNKLLNLEDLTEEELEKIKATFAPPAASSPSNPNGLKLPLPVSNRRKKILAKLSGRSVRLDNCFGDLGSNSN
jgi:hypothetical protein